MRRRVHFQILLLLILLAGCAIPVPPVGGPPDQNPPRLLDSFPANGSVHVLAVEMTIRFDERLEERSVRQAVSITPDFDTPPRVEAHGSEIRIRFPESLRENTTYLVSMDTKLRDAHGVALSSPITIAFGTGASLNQGQLQGIVRGADRGLVIAGVDVFAFKTDSPGGDSLAPIDSTASSDQAGVSDSSLTRTLYGRHPDYRTQTDPRGRFLFEHLSEVDYFILAVRDKNGNRVLDPAEPIAIPPAPSILADSTGSLPTRPWVLFQIDDTRPIVRRATSTNSHELSLRFSEPVVLSTPSPSDWEISDSTSGLNQPISIVYSGTDPRDVVVRTDSLAPGSYRLLLSGAVADSSGNRLKPDTLYFKSSAGTFSVHSRFLSYLPESMAVDPSGTATVWPGVPVGLHISSPVVPGRQSPFSVRDTSGTGIDVKTTSEDGVRLFFDSARIPDRFVVAVYDSLQGPNRTFVRADDSMLGELTGVITYAGDTADIIVELIRTPGNMAPLATGVIDTAGTVRFARLPEQTRFRLRAFADLNGDRAWSAGSVSPYRTPEPIGWLDVQEPIRARWETVAADTLTVESLF